MLAMMMPALIFLTMMIVQAGLYYHYQHRAAAAADRGAVAAATNGGDAAAGRAAAAAFLTHLPLGGAQRPRVDVQIRADDVVVTVTGSFHALVPIGTSTVHATATAPIEDFIPETER